MDEKHVLKLFERQKIITIGQLVSMLECSKITARRRLKLWRTHTSINKNGRYYVLPHVPMFDKNGLWRYQTVLFSQHGNLKQTIAALINNSPKGLSAAEIAQIVDLAPNSSFLSQFKDTPGVRRQKRQGRFIYLSDRPEVFARQKSRFEAIEFPTDAQAVVILVQLIKHPGLDVERLAQRVADQGLSIKPSAIEALLHFHGLLKKTPATKP